MNLAQELGNPGHLRPKDKCTRYTVFTTLFCPEKLGIVTTFVHDLRHASDYVQEMLLRLAYSSAF